MIHFQRQSSAAAPAAALALGTVIIVLTIRRYVFSQFLTADDTIYLSRAAFGRSKREVWRWELDFMNVAASAVHDPRGAKVAAAAMIVVTGGVLAWLLARLTGRPAVSTLAALLVTLYPISIEPGVFAFGAHPFFAAPFAFAGIIALGSRGPMGVPGTGVIILSGVLFAISSVMSPTAVALIVAPPAIIVSEVVLGRRWRRHVLPPIAASLVIPLVLAPRTLDYHYNTHVGWVDRSPASMLRNARRALELVWTTTDGAGTIARVIVGVGLGGLCILLAIAVVRGRDTERNDEPTDDAGDARFGMIALTVCSGLALVPGLVVTSFTRRYIALAFLFAGALLCAAIIRTTARRGLLRPTAFALAIALGGSVIAADELRDRGYGQEYRTFETTVELVDAESASWPAMAQVVLVLEDGMQSSTHGYNHWSTWFIRSLAGRTDITALVGQSAWLNTEPFVRRYRDKGDEYWRVINGRSSRLRMSGLTADHPLYVYRLDPRDGAFHPTAVTFASEGAGAVTVDIGGTVDEARCESRAAALQWQISEQQLRKYAERCSDAQA